MFTIFARHSHIHTNGDGLVCAGLSAGRTQRPASGRASLTPTELDVVRLIQQGLSNKDIAARLFASPRT
jgi:DNA-binding CsgD family transcriptional regulator